MAKREFKLNEWLDEVTKGETVSPEERAALDKVLGREKVQSSLAASVMRQADYSAAHDALRQDRETFDKERKDIQKKYDAEFASLSTWRGTAQEKLEAEEKARKDAEAALAASQRKYAKALKEAGVEPDELDDDLDVEPRRRAPAFDPAKEWETREIKLRSELKAEFERGAADLVKMMGPYPIQLMQLQAEHQRLFPDRPLDVAALYQKSVETSKPMDEIWVSEFKVPERRAELAQQAIDKQIEDARADERRKVTEQLSRPPMIEPESFGSPALKKFAAKPASPNGDGLSGIDRAVAAHHQHKHAPPTSPHWKGAQTGA